MKIICNSCKAIIDTEKHDFCPKCGANFVYGERLKLDNSANVRDEFNEQQEELNRRQIEQKIKSNENAAQNQAEPRMSDSERNAQWEEHRKYHQKNAAKKADNKATGKKNGCIGCFAVVLFFIFGMGNVLEDSGEDISDVMENIEDVFAEFIEEETADYTTAYNWEDEIPAVITALPDELNEIVYGSTQDEYDTTPNTALAGETAYADTYCLTLNNVSIFESQNLKPPAEGYVYMRFRLELINTSDADGLFYQPITLEADGVECNAASFSALYLPGELAPGESYESGVIFEVPKDAIFLDLYYGDELVIYALSYDIEGYEPDFGYEYDESGAQETTTTTEENTLPIIIR